MAHTSSPSIQFITLTLLILPAVTIILYFLTVFPHNPDSIIIHPSLSSLSKDTRSWQIYPADFFEGGAYATFPYGRVSRIVNRLHARFINRSYRWDTGSSAHPMATRYTSVLLVYWQLTNTCVGCPNSRPFRSKYYLARHRTTINCKGFPGATLWRVSPFFFVNGLSLTYISDLYGRGYSDAPQATYDTSLYVTQLALLMQYIGWDKANIVGVSMVRSLCISLLDSICYSYLHGLLHGRWRGCPIFVSRVVALLQLLATNFPTSLPADSLSLHRQV